jgi:hypothetical protein
MGNKQGGNPAAAGWMKRVAVADALGIKVSKVRRLEGDLLHPVRGADGTWYFDPDEVEVARGRIPPGQTARAAPDALATLADGELAARLFPLFERGMVFGDVVKATHVRPAVVRALFWEWQLGYRRPRVELTASQNADEGADDATDEEDDDKVFVEWEDLVRRVYRGGGGIERLARRLPRL